MLDPLYQFIPQNTAVAVPTPRQGTETVGYAQTAQRCSPFGIQILIICPQGEGLFLSLY